MWDLGKWYRSIHLQSRNRDTDVENKGMDTKWAKGGWNELRDPDGHVHTIDTMYKTDD